MDWSAFRHSFRRFFRSGLNVTLLLLGAAAIAGCSGSGSSTTSDAGNPDSPPQQPPSDDPPADDPPGDGTTEPTVSFSAQESVVASGDTVTLTWSSQNATSCSASGGWSGGRATQGSVEVGPLTQSTTFTLNCTGSGGNVMDMLSVSVLGVVALAWEPPTENVDGSPLNDLAGYRIYYGEISGTYTEELAVSDTLQTDHEMALPSGSYYFAMTALDAEGNESAHSNEVLKVVN